MTLAVIWCKLRRWLVLTYFTFVLRSSFYVRWSVTVHQTTKPSFCGQKRDESRPSFDKSRQPPSKITKKLPRCVLLCNKSLEIDMQAISNSNWHCIQPLFLLDVSGICNWPLQLSCFVQLIPVDCIFIFVLVKWGFSWLLRSSRLLSYTLALLREKDAENRIC